jgi:hypothetical protein
VNKSYTAAESRFAGLIKSLPCVVCRRLGLPLDRHVDLHHIAKGSSRQNNWLVAPLCRDHHDPYRTGCGLHGMGEQRFCSAFKVPHGTEYGLLAWVNEDLMLHLGLKRAAA